MVAYEELQSITAPVRVTLQDRVYQELRLAIMGGRFQPGRSLSIRGVAGALGVSAMPVREALRQLAAEQAITTAANRTYGIAVMTRARFADLVEVRQLVEGQAARLAAGRIAPAEIEHLREINAAMRSAMTAENLALFIEHNRAFHFGIYRASGSEVLVPIIETLWLQVGPYLGAVYGETMPADDAPDHHEEILQALAQRDAEGAARALSAEIAEGAAQIAEAGQFAD